MGWFSYLFAHPSKILELALQHLKLVSVSGILAVLIAVPLGILITRPKFKKFGKMVINVINVFQTIPSLALVGIMLPIFGLGFIPAVVALILKALLPILRNTYAGINDVDEAMLEAGKGMGMSNLQILFKIELPLAMKVIIAGIRTSLVINVGTAALVFLVGGGGLGNLIFTGIALVDMAMIVAGAIPTALLAVIVDYVLGKIQAILTPRGLDVEVEDNADVAEAY